MRTILGRHKNRAILNFNHIGCSSYKMMTHGCHRPTLLPLTFMSLHHRVSRS